MLHVISVALLQVCNVSNISCSTQQILIGIQLLCVHTGEEHSSS